MNHVTERIFNFSTWSIAGAGIAVNFESIKGGILFLLGFILLCLQIYLHIIRIKKENKP